MIRLRHKMLIHMLRIFDQLIMLGMAAAAVYLRPEVALKGKTYILEATFKIEDALGLLVLIIGWIGIYDYFIRYRADRLVALSTQLKNLAKATSFSTFWLLIIGVVFTVESLNVLNLLIFYAVVTTIGILSRLFLRLLLISARRSGYNYRYLLVIGANERAREIAARIERKPELGYKIVGFVAETPEALREWENAPHGEYNNLGLLDDLRRILTGERVDEVFVCLPVEARFSDIARIIQHARDLGIVVRIMPDFTDDYLLKNLRIEEFENEYVVTLFREQMLLQLLLKRLLDLFVSLVMLIVLFPLMALTAILIKLTSPGPVFFIQKRVGMNQREFKLYKFRSMVANAEERKSALFHLNERDGPAFKIENDPRITPLGRFLRKTSIDELPQLFNVLTGKMSLVGPRPPLPEEVEKYEWLFRKRLSVKPGITCIWQISGRNNVSFERWMEMDHEYIENWTVWLDLQILLKTIPAVLFSRGAS
jgi:exopolysaccharide biosynthesis polyprenyl glycosylphosphotransferase